MIVQITKLSEQAKIRTHFKIFTKLQIPIQKSKDRNILHPLLDQDPARTLGLCAFFEFVSCPVHLKKMNCWFLFSSMILRRVKARNWRRSWRRSRATSMKILEERQNINKWVYFTVIRSLQSNFPLNPFVYFHNHHHQFNVHVLPRLIKGMDGCIPTA